MVIDGVTFLFSIGGSADAPRSALRAPPHHKGWMQNKNRKLLDRIDRHRVFCETRTYHTMSTAVAGCTNPTASLRRRPYRVRCLHRGAILSVPPWPALIADRTKNLDKCRLHLELLQNITERHHLETKKDWLNEPANSEASMKPKMKTG